MIWFIWVYAGILIFALMRDKIGLAKEQWVEKLCSLIVLIALWPLLPLMALIAENLTVADVVNSIKDKFKPTEEPTEEV